MEDSFKSRVDETFGALFGPASNGGAQFWSVKESCMVSDKAEAGAVREVESSGSDGDDDDGIRYENFLKLQRSKRHGRRCQGEYLEAEVSGQEDLEELESEEEDDEEDEEDEEEGRRHAKRNRRGQEQRAVESVSARNREMREEEDEESVMRMAPILDEDPEEEARQMRLLVGMDCTLDFEEEEDEYDKVAVGSEGTEDRLFMGQIRDFGTSLNLITPLPTSFDEVRQVRRDVRANHEAALARLEEDNRQAAKIVANESSKSLIDTFGIGLELKDCAVGNGDTNVGEQLPPRKNEEDAMEIDGDGLPKEEALPAEKNQTQDVVTAPLVPCVRDGKKRKSGKRVRFTMDEDLGIDCRVGISSTTESVVSCTSTMSLIPEVDQQSGDQMKIPLSNRYSRVPDHVRNPSKYIHYTIDWSEVNDEQQNLAAFYAFKGPTSVSNDMVSDNQEEVMVTNPVESAKISFNPLVSSRVVIGKDDVSKRGPKVLGMQLSGLIHQVGPVNIIANFETDIGQGEPKASEDNHDASIPSEKKAGEKIGRLLDDIEVKVMTLRILK